MQVGTRPPPPTNEVPMPVKIGGLPAHVLLIHAVVVLLPVAAIMLVASALWPAARRKLGFLSPAVALVALVLVPITTHAGEWLEARLPESKAIEHHADLGDQLLPWAAGLFVLSAAVWLTGRRFDTTWRPRPAQPDAEEQTGSGGTATLTRAAPAATRQTLPVWVAVVLAVLSVAVSVGTMILLYRIGESGADAVWSGVVNLPARS